MTDSKPSWRSINKDRKPFQYVKINSEEAWPHTGNIHCIGKMKNPSLLLDQPVCVTQKIDGSNLSIEIRRLFGEWKIIKLNGRNTMIWDQTTSTDITKISYGNPNQLDNLPLEMFDYCVRLAEILKKPDGTPVDHLFVYGESYKMEGQRLASWHPFGYRIPKTKIMTEEAKDSGDLDDLDDSLENLSLEINFLTERTHKAFLCATSKKIPEITTVEEFFDLLLKYEGHVICPPICMFVGILRDCIEALFEKMKVHDRIFEGCFIIFENRPMGFKWKTGLFEEQLYIKPLSSTLFTNEKDAEAYRKLEYIFNNRPVKEGRESMLRSKDKAEGEKLKTVTLQTLRDDLMKACIHEISKFTSESQISTICKKDRKDLVQKLCELTIQEIIQLYTESGYEISWSPDELKRNAFAVINPYIMKIKYEQNLESST